MSCCDLEGRGGHSLTHTCFVPAPPAGHPALLSTAHFLAGRRDAYWLNELLQGLRPGNTELQQGNVIVKGLAVVVFMDHDSPHWGDEPGVPLHAHAKVRGPGCGVRQPGTKGRKHGVRSLRHRVWLGESPPQREGCGKGGLTFTPCCGSGLCL